MEWLAEGIESGKLQWCCTAHITHLRPAVDYARGATFIGRLESVRDDWPQAVRHMTAEQGLTKRDRTGLHAWSGIHVNRRRSERFVCSEPESCGHELVRNTQHTPRTVQLTNELYRQDFIDFNYTMAVAPIVASRSPPAQPAARRT